MVVEVAQEHNETHGRLDISQHTPVPNSVLRMLLMSINGENESIESKFHRHPANTFVFKSKLP